MLIVGISAYNEAPGIERAIRSVLSVADEIRVYDGAYRTFPHVVADSRDGMVQIVQRLQELFPQVRFIPKQSPYVDQMEKRNRILSDAVGHTLLVLDGDEWIADPCGLHDLEPEQVGWVQVWSNLYAEPYRQPRLFSVSPGMHYMGKHHWIFDRDGFLVASHRSVGSRYTHIDTGAKLYNVRRRERGAAKAQLRKAAQKTEGAFVREIEVYPEAGDKIVPAKNISPERVRAAFQDVGQYIPGEPTWTATAMFTRPWAVGPWFQHLKQLVLPWDDMELLVVVDNVKRLGDVVRRGLSTLRPFPRYGVRLFVTGVPAPGEKSTGRRQRIVRNWSLLLPEIRGRYILGMEDDTFPQYDAYPRLADYVLSGQADFAQASIVGRWSVQMVPHWNFEKDSSGVYCRLVSGRPPRDGESRLVQITGGGWYCFVASTDAFREVGVRMPQSDCPMGPDVQMVRDLSERGMVALGDWDIWCEHMTPNGILRPDTGRGVHVMTLERQRGGVWRPMKELFGHFHGATLSLGRRAGSNGSPSKPIGMKIFTLQPNRPRFRTINIGGKTYDGPFEMVDAGRVKQLLGRGQVRLVKEEDYYGVPFNGARLPQSAGKAPDLDKEAEKALVSKEASKAAENVTVNTPVKTTTPTIDSWQPNRIRGREVPSDPPSKQVEADKNLTPAERLKRARELRRKEREAEEASKKTTDESVSESETEDAEDLTTEEAIERSRAAAEEDDTVPDGGAKCVKCGKVLKRASGLPAHMAMHEREEAEADE